MPSGDCLSSCVQAQVRPRRLDPVVPMMLAVSCTHGVEMNDSGAAIRRRALCKVRAIGVLGLSLCLLKPATAEPLVFAVDTATEMPLAQLREGRVVDGLVYDLGRELAQRLGREARFLPLPRLRLLAALESGEAELACVLLPQWLPGSLDWSKPFIPQADWLLSRVDVPRPRELADLAGQHIGAVHGFSYPALAQALGDNWRRDDAPTAQANLRKLALGRVPHAIVSRRVFEYRQRSQRLPVHPPLVLSDGLSHCALSRRASLTLQALNAAIDQLLADGALTRLESRYR